MMIEHASEGFVEVSRARWPVLLEEIERYVPEIRLECDETVMSSRLLSHRRRDDRYSTAFIIDIPSPDLSKKIIGDRKKTQFYALYVLDGTQHCVHCAVTLESFVIYNGLPAIAMNLQKPIRLSTSEVAIHPTQDKPVLLDLSAFGAEGPVHAVDISISHIITEEIQEQSPVRSWKSKGGIALELPGLESIKIDGEVVDSETGRLVIKVNSMKDQDRRVLNSYLSDGFNATFPSRMKHALRAVHASEYGQQALPKLQQQLILIIDDEPDSHLAAVLLLEHDGFRIVTAVNGEDGVRKARQLRPDLILLDVDMPRLDGLETLRLLRMFVETKKTPVVMLTADAEVSTVTRASDYNISGYISKPYNPSELSRRISSLLV